MARIMEIRTHITHIFTAAAQEDRICGDGWEMEIFGKFAFVRTEPNSGVCRDRKTAKLGPY